MNKNNQVDLAVGLVWIVVVTVCGLGLGAPIGTAVFVAIWIAVSMERARRIERKLDEQASR